MEISKFASKISKKSDFVNLISQIEKTKKTRWNKISRTWTLKYSAFCRKPGEKLRKFYHHEILICQGN